MVDLLKCVECSKPYRFDKLRECPSCGARTPYSYQSPDEPSTPEIVAIERTGKLLGKYQQGSNLLIRSLAISFFVYLSSGVLGSILTWVGLLNSNSILMIVGPIVILAGFICSLVMCIDVISRSK